LSEPAVTLTDYALAVLCAALSWRVGVREGGDAALRRGFALFFAAAAISPLLGGTVHGFFPDDESPTGKALWRATLVSIGCAAALAAWIATRAWWGERGARRSRPWLAALLAAYVALVLAGVDRFAVAIAAYLPASLLLLLAFARAARRRGELRIGLGALGLALAFVGALGQQLRLGLHPVYFDHNAVYHVIQGGAFLLVFAGALPLVRGGERR
jgi:hypothetical protein